MVCVQSGARGAVAKNFDIFGPNVLPCASMLRSCALLLAGPRACALFLKYMGHRLPPSFPMMTMREYRPKHQSARFSLARIKYEKFNCAHQSECRDCVDTHASKQTLRPESFLAFWVIWCFVMFAHPKRTSVPPSIPSTFWATRTRCVRPAKIVIVNQLTAHVTEWTDLNMVAIACGDWEEKRRDETNQHFVATFVEWNVFLPFCGPVKQFASTFAHNIIFCSRSFCSDIFL